MADCINYESQLVKVTNGQLKLLLQHAAEMGAKRALSEAGLIKPYLKKSEAYRMYGKTNVERWLQEGLVTPRKDGSDSAAWRIERNEIEAVAKASNRHTYLSVDERKTA